MTRDFSVTRRIAAPPPRVWEVLADVLGWPDWLPTVTAVEALDQSSLALGARFRITQPRLRPAIWSVVRLEPFRAFSWETRAPGVRTLGDHSVTLVSGGMTEVRLGIRFSGALSLLAAAIFGRLTMAYLAREAVSLETRVRAKT